MIRTFIFIFFLFGFFGVIACAPGQTKIDLTGTWKFSADPHELGVHEKWYLNDLVEHIQLPGTMAMRGKGNDITLETQFTGSIDGAFYTHPKYEDYRQPGNIMLPWFLTPVKEYVGPAWYQKEIEIPLSWEGKDVELFLERCHWESAVWINEQYAGMQNSLVAPHKYTLSGLKAGKHRLTIRIDNTVKINIGNNSHSITDHTQTNWNGIMGEISLRAIEPVHFSALKIFPDIDNRKIKIETTIHNASTKRQKADILFRTEQLYPAAQKAFPELTEKVRLNPGINKLTFDYPMGENVKLWSEFTPVVYTLTANILHKNGSHSTTESFGMREISVQGTQFAMNGTTIFLRGNLECAIFPETGAADMTVEGWLNIFNKAREFGVNHFRFHSWCPPRAAFIAADITGMMLQVETPVWPANFEGNDKLIQFVKEEGDRILQEYGNHPSFTMLGVGNEIGPVGNTDTLALYQIVSQWKENDDRRLYTAAAGWPSLNVCDYNVRQEARVFNWLSGATTRLDTAQLNTFIDYRELNRVISGPYVTHEMASWCVFPDFDEIEKYTGVLKAHNLSIAKDLLRKSGMMHQAKDFHMASGRFQSLIIKEEIEALLRTPNHAGYQQLQLQDFSGQGTALIGVLDAFWDEKKYISADFYKSFSDSTVLLSRINKVIWHPNETFRAELEMAHFGRTALQKTRIHWAIKDHNGHTLSSGFFDHDSIPLGNGFHLGQISQRLNGFAAPSKYVLEVAINGKDIKNRWDFWVYPETHETEPGNVIITSTWDDEIIDQLQQGATVLFSPQALLLKEKTAGRFSPVFWNRLWFNFQRNHTLGTLTDPGHPIFAQFPTEYHTNWQWYDIKEYSKPIVMDNLPQELQPLIQFIDDWFSSRKLAMAFEARVGEGKLLVLSLDLETRIDKRPASRQLLTSILSYMNSNEFSPLVQLESDDISGLLFEFLPMPAASIVESSSEEFDSPASNILNNDIFSVWHSQWIDNAPLHPHSFLLDLGEATEFSGIALFPRQEGLIAAISSFDIYLSNEPQMPEKPFISGVLPYSDDVQLLHFDQKEKARYIRFVAKEGFNGEPWACLSKFRLLP